MIPQSATASADKKGLSNDTQATSDSRDRRPLSITQCLGYSDVARNAAERRWNQDLLQRFRHDAIAYATVCGMIDVRLMTDATDAEVKCRGTGLQRLIKALIERGLVC